MLVKDGKFVNTQKENGINQGRGASMQPNHWLPLTEYALRSGMSISTLRRKIKANSIRYKMEEGRYLIRLDELEEELASPPGFASSDASRMPTLPAKPVDAVPAPLVPVSEMAGELEEIRVELKNQGEESSLKWRALEARVAGIARKLDLFSEQMAELKMLVKVFEEKLDERV